MGIKYLRHDFVVIKNKFIGNNFKNPNFLV